MSVLSTNDQLEIKDVDSMVRLPVERLTFDTNGIISPETRFELAQYFGEQYAKADLVFILVSGDDPDSLLMAKCIAQFLANMPEKNQSSLTLVFLWQQNFKYNRSHSEQLLRQISTSVNTLVTTSDENSQHSFKFLPKECAHSLGKLRAYESCLAIKSVVDLICKAGLIGLDFADVRTVFSNQKEACFAIGYGFGPNRAEEAAIEAVKQLAQIWGSLEQFSNNTMLVELSASEMCISEFNKVGDVIVQNSHDTTFIKIGTTSDATMLGNAMRVTLFVTKQ